MCSVQLRFPLRFRSASSPYSYTYTHLVQFQTCHVWNVWSEKPAYSMATIRTKGGPQPHTATHYYSSIVIVVIYHAKNCGQCRAV